MPRRSRSFRPPHCPNPDCESHGDPATWRFKKKGFFERRHGPRRVQRYVCQRCDRNFSAQTFAVDYWLKSPRLLKAVFWGIVNCSGLRQLARAGGVRHATLQRHVERLGRHCLLLHEALRPRGAPAEAVVLDGFRTLESGHYWPFDLHLLVGASHYVYAFNDAELRRSGAHTPAQRAKRLRLEARFGRPDPQATRKAAQEILARGVPEGARIDLYSDDHRAYARAIARLRTRDIRHHVTSSKAARTPSNPLFPANLADLLLRHASANHKRETIAFSKRRQGALYRAAIWLVWRNYMQARSERKRDAPPGVQIGVLPRALTLAEVLRERLFPWKQPLRGWLEDCYFARIPTRPIPNARAHALRYAV
jgi:transposase-like protein